MLDRPPVQMVRVTSEGVVVVPVAIAGQRNGVRATSARTAGSGKASRSIDGDPTGMAKRKGRRAAGGERRQWLASSLLVALAPLLAFPRGTSSERIVNGTWSAILHVRVWS